MTGIRQMCAISRTLTLLYFFCQIDQFFNHIYEMRNHLPVHSERAPVEEWVKWRNAYVDIEIAEYKKFVL